MRRPWGSVIERNGTISVRYGPRPGTFETLPFGATRRDAEALLAKRRLELEAGTWIVPSKTTVGEFLPEWLRLSGVTRNTLRAYQQRVARLVEVLGPVVLQKLTANHLDAAMRKMRQSPKTVNDTLDVGRAAFNWAVKRGLLAKNQFELVDRLPLEESTKIALSPVEAATLLTELRGSGDSLDNMLAFMLLTLRRYGEAAGLRWQDVDLERRTYAVNQVWLQEQHLFAPAGNRKVKHATYQCSDVTLAVLKRQEMAQRVAREEARKAGWEWVDIGTVFTPDLGGPVPRTTLQHELTRVCRRARVPLLSLHELRHTGASLLIYQGADQWQLMAAGGWSSLAMVERTYAHLFAARTQEAVDGLAAILTRRSS